MKAFVTSSIVALATVASANPLPQHGSMGMDMDMKPSPPPQIKSIAPLFRTATNPKSTRIEMKYGPYDMPSSNDTTLMKMPGMEDETGVVDVMLMNGKATKPCSDCTLKYAKADLTYKDGTPANLNTGAWLHHLTLSVQGPGRADVACPNYKDGERMLVVHNDRNDTYYGLSGTDNYGYYLSNADILNLVLELKNDATQVKQVYLTLTFEYTPGKPASLKSVKPLWMDAQNCQAPSSEIEPPKDKKIFTLESQPWSAPADMDLLTTVGHMHDGATHLEISVNNKLVCNSVAQYGGNKDYEPTKEAITKLGLPDMAHITRYSPCAAFGKVKKGDQIRLKAFYDFEKNKPGYGTSGVPTGVMGIALMFLGVD